MAVMVAVGRLAARLEVATAAVVLVVTMVVVLVSPLTFNRPSTKFLID